VVRIKAGYAGDKRHQSFRRPIGDRPWEGNDLFRLAIFSENTFDFLQFHSVSPDLDLVIQPAGVDQAPVLALPYEITRALPYGIAAGRQADELLARILRIVPVSRRHLRSTQAELTELTR
jgi:hypothetical protein